MNGILRALNLVLLALSALGVGWYVVSAQTFRPLLGFFILAFCCGFGGTWALLSARKKVWIGYMIVSFPSLVVFGGLQVLAFVISPGTGVGVAPIIGAAIAICALSLVQVLNRIYSGSE